MKQNSLKVISNVEIAHEIYEVTFAKSEQFEAVQAGQFLHLKMNRRDLILRRPISIADSNQDQCTIIYRVVGDGTEDMTSLKSFDEVDVLGPLGHGFDVEAINEGDVVFVIGGGIGVAPLYLLGKELKKKGAQLTFVLGFRDAKDVYYKEKFAALGDVVITTDDGSEGIQGHVGIGVASVSTKPKAVYACGPLPLLKFVQHHFSEMEHVYCSLEERMACGMGACHGCDTKDKKHRVCYDGPVFKASEVEL